MFSELRDRMGARPPRAPQVLGNDGRPARRTPRLLLQPHRMAARAQAPGRAPQGPDRRHERPGERPAPQLSEKVSFWRFFLAFFARNTYSYV